MTENANEAIIRIAYEAYAEGDVARMLGVVDPDLEWTYLDPSLEDPPLQTCQGRSELDTALHRQIYRGLRSHLEEVRASGDRVMVVRTPGIDAYRVRPADDRYYDVFTVRQGRIVAIRACHDRDEALAVAGIA
jgi:ketosteroid isomerase-like protein